MLIMTYFFVAAEFIPIYGPQAICTKNLEKLCYEYVLKIRDFFLLSVIAVVVVIVGFAVMLLALASSMVEMSNEDGQGAVKDKYVNLFLSVYL